MKLALSSLWPFLLTPMHFSQSQPPSHQLHCILFSPPIATDTIPFSALPCCIPHSQTCRFQNKEGEGNWILEGSKNWRRRKNRIPVILFVLVEQVSPFPLSSQVTNLLARGLTEQEDCLTNLRPLEWKPRGKNHTVHSWLNAASQVVISNLFLVT